MRFKLALAASAATLAVGGAAQAQVREVEELVVAGRLEESLPTELARFGNRLEVVSAEQLQDAGFVDVGQALERMVPGLHLAPQSGPFSYNTASLQGSRPGEILYLVDGVRISNRLYNTTPPLDTVPAYMVDRIEMLDGPQGLFFGTQAVAGVINTVSRPFTEALTGRVQIGGDSNARRSLNAYASGSLGRHRIVAWAGRDAAEGYQPFPEDETEPSATDRRRGYRLTSAGLKYAVDLTDDVRISASYQHIDGYVDFARSVSVVRAVNRRDEEIAWGKLDWRLNDRTQLFVKTYWHDWDSHYDEDDNVPGGGIETVSDNEFWGFWDYGLNAVAQFSVRPGFDAFLGYDLQNYWGKDDVVIIADKTETTHAVFGQLRFGPELLANTHLAVGVRHNMPSEGETATVWSASGQYDVSDTLFVRGSVGTAFRLPDAESLFANDPIFNGEIGNPDLKPERSRNLNGSVGARAGGLTFELVGFWRETKDLIDFVETADPDVFTFGNTPGKVTAKGFEAVVSGRLSDAWSVSASYTHARTRAEGSDVQLAGVPEDYAQAALTWKPQGAPVGAAVVANWVGEVADQVSSGFGRQERGHYAVVDLDAWVTFGAHDRHRLSARLENALDEAYVTRVNRAFRDATGDAYLIHYRGVPRTLHVTYAYSF